MDNKKTKLIDDSRMEENLLDSMYKKGVVPDKDEINSIGTSIEDLVEGLNYPYKKDNL